VGTIQVVEHSRRLVLIIVGVLVAGSLVAGPAPLIDLEPVSADGVQCGAGTYSDTGFQPCVLADSGYFVDVLGATQQTACPVGTYQPGIGQIFCVEADEGHYVDAPASTSQSPCSPGTFNDMRGQASCTVAEPGSYVAIEGATSASQCGVGSYSPASAAESCTFASPGYFVDTTGSAEQFPCAPGTFAAGLGSESCDAAEAGYFVEGEAAAAQVPCSPGSFAAETRSTSCTLAPAGSYVSESAQIAAALCPLGTFSAVPGASSCTQAPVGSFVAEVGATSATLCPAGSTTLDTGQSECIPDPTAPVVTMSVTGGTLGAGGWYTSGPVVVAFEVDDPESDETVDGCDGGSVSTPTPGTTFACSVTSVGGTTTESITIRLDADKPVITFTGNAGSYRVVSTVAIRCAATDAVSGVADVRCPRVNSPAWRLTAGRTTLAARATDRAGNVATASSSFTVRVTSKDLCALTRRFVTSSKRYIAAKPSTQLSADAAVRNLCLSTGRTKAFRAAVDGLATDKFLASGQAKALKRLVAAL
jgi:hypothetical protein